MSDPSVQLSGQRHNLVIQSSQIRRKNEDFSPILKSVETVQAELPSQILDIEEDLAMEVIEGTQEVVTSVNTGHLDSEPGNTEDIVVECTQVEQSSTVEQEDQVTEQTVEEEVTSGQCIVQYVNENGEIIEVAEVTE